MRRDLYDYLKVGSVDEQPLEHELSDEEGAAWVLCIINRECTPRISTFQIHTVLKFSLLLASDPPSTGRCNADYDPSKALVALRIRVDPMPIHPYLPTTLIVDSTGCSLTLVVSTRQAQPQHPHP
jgi:hypothetical protein